MVVKMWLKNPDRQLLYQNLQAFDKNAFDFLEPCFPLDFSLRYFFCFSSPPLDLRLLNSGLA